MQRAHKRRAKSKRMLFYSCFFSAQSVVLTNAQHGSAVSAPPDRHMSLECGIRPEKLHTDVQGTRKDSTQEQAKTLTSIKQYSGVMDQTIIWIDFIHSELKLPVFII